MKGNRLKGYYISNSSVTQSVAYTVALILGNTQHKFITYVDHDWASGTHGISVPSRLHTGT
jgi:hypothetical protein